MKQVTYSLAVAMILLTSACRKDSIKTGNTTLTGKWNLVQRLADPGDGSGTWQPVSNSTTLDLNTDGTVGGNTFPSYVTYAIKDNVTITFSQSDKTLQNYRYKISHDTLSMSPGGPIICFEPCGIRFKKN